MHQNDLQKLDEIYRRTIYVVEDETSAATFRVGQPSADLGKILRERNTTEWAFITPYNPYSTLLSASENKQRQARLIEELKKRNLAFLRGCGIGDHWQSEPSLLILGITFKAALEIGRLFEQNAIIVGNQITLMPELIWCFEQNLKDKN